MKYLLDTNSLSELRKPSCDPSVAAWFDGVDSGDLYLSALVVGEIRQGIDRLRRRGDERQAALFETWLETLHDEFAARIVPISAGIAECWGSLNAVRPLPVVDGLLLATAIVDGHTFVTREARRYADTGAEVLDPWQFEPPAPPA